MIDLIKTTIADVKIGIKYIVGEFTAGVLQWIINVLIINIQIWNINKQ